MTKTLTSVFTYLGSTFYYDDKRSWNPLPKTLTWSCVPIKSDFYELLKRSTLSLFIYNNSRILRMNKLRHESFFVREDPVPSHLSITVPFLW